MQMYCTFVLFVNQYFPGLPASRTHCSFQGQKMKTTKNSDQIKMIKRRFLKPMVNKGTVKNPCDSSHLRKYHSDYSVAGTGSADNKRNQVREIWRSGLLYGVFFFYHFPDPFHEDGTSTAVATLPTVAVGQQRSLRATATVPPRQTPWRHHGEQQWQSRQRTKAFR
jgi:hypothetical protein